MVVPAGARPAGLTAWTIDCACRRRPARCSGRRRRRPGGGQLLQILPAGQGAGDATEAVDVVISNCVINLSVDKPKVIAEMFRVLTAARRSHHPSPGPGPAPPGAGRQPRSGSRSPNWPPPPRPAACPDRAGCRECCRTDRRSRPAPGTRCRSGAVADRGGGRGVAVPHLLPQAGGGAIGHGVLLRLSERVSLIDGCRSILDMSYRGMSMYGVCWSAWWSPRENH